MSDVIELLKVIIWPAIVVFVFFRSGGPISRMLDAASEGRLSVKAGASGVEITQVARAAAAAGVAAGAQAARECATADDPAIASQIAHAVQATVTATSTTEPRRILWVDDNPSNNDLLARSFRDLGIEVVEAASTEQAMTELERRRSDLVITDMSRPPDREAGLTLIRRMRAARISTPVIIYAAGWAAAHRGEEAEQGVALITNRPNEVYARALGLLREGR